jgi:hypothetical protein
MGIVQFEPKRKGLMFVLKKQSNNCFGHKIRIIVIVNGYICELTSSKMSSDFYFLFFIFPLENKKNLGNFRFLKCKFEKDCYFYWKTHQTFKTTKLKKQTLKLRCYLFLHPICCCMKGTTNWVQKQMGVLRFHSCNSSSEITNICFQA